MLDNGDLKDDVKVPEGELGQKINKMFKEDEKDTSKRYIEISASTGHHTDHFSRRHHSRCHEGGVLH